MKINFNVIGLLIVILITLKCMELTPISWLWATSPLWIPLGGIIALLALIGIFSMLVELIDIIARKLKK